MQSQHALRARWRDWTPEQIIDDLRVYVPGFQAITSPDPIFRENLGNDEVSSWVERLYRMPIPTSVYPYILKILAEHNSEKISSNWVVLNLRLIESFLVRRAFAGFEPTGLHSVFKDLWRYTQGDPEKFIDTIDANQTVHFPEDEEFASDIKGRPLYGRRLAKYILADYERNLSGGDPYPEVDLTIDHVMPQELTSQWKSIISEDVHAKLKDTWANLVPLSGPANSEKGRKPWSEAKQYFLTETIFRTTKRLAHQYEDWNEATIKARAEQLALWAIDRWPKHF